MKRSVAISILSQEICLLVPDERFDCLGRCVDCGQVDRSLLVVVALVEHHLHSCFLKITRQVEEDVEAGHAVLGGQVEEVLLVHEDAFRLYAAELWVNHLYTTSDH